ncbi:conjugal transfer protein TraF [Vibrio alginolyticus]|uniref:conjugal transfer protein TraF n=1 Tax=Vibrio diabolicus TaxID=50719 RepID=UPI00193DD2DD|nr:conjugal transfer protein TraF [Vibrio diabolicus]EGQ8101727.1 conjugal transfer protein TraF [Vibrio parahaemolyticus]EHA1078758.1 conjugal transfer protein TraF [Vibrio alginolyticus]EGQ8547911.1 hypothetical protein [Vibrio parahaemolyticus]EGR3042438.1 hypothetical protein [Vibrio parahaemolyticus]EHA1137198.1 conjugal transfer protein TraF [Vibrio alginolyticus]
MKGYALLLLAILSCSNLALADSSTSKERGRYWYEEPKEEPKEETEKDVAALQPENEEYTRPVVPPFKEVMEMHPKQIAKLYEEVHDYHVMKPTQDTAVDLLLLENVLAKKSRAAAAVKQLAVLKNPVLSGQFENPIAPSVKNIANQKQSALVHERLVNEGEHFAFVVFTQPRCGACKVFRNTLALFRDKYGWPIKEYNIHENVELVKRFNIYGTPTTILVRKNTEQWLPVAQGAEPFTNLVKNTSQGVRLLKGEITPDQWFTSDVQTDSYFDPSYTPIEVRREEP